MGEQEVLRSLHRHIHLLRIHSHHLWEVEVAVGLHSLLEMEVHFVRLVEGEAFFLDLGEEGVELVLGLLGVEEVELFHFLHMSFKRLHKITTRVEGYKNYIKINTCWRWRRSSSISSGWRWTSVSVVAWRRGWWASITSLRWGRWRSLSLKILCHDTTMFYSRHGILNSGIDKSSCLWIFKIRFLDTSVFK